MWVFCQYFLLKFCKVFCNLFQIVPTPTLEDLVTPQLESESKKPQASAPQVKMPTKAPAAPVVEGTSVMPRQRPKGSSATPLNLNNLPLALNTSPTATKKTTQSPVTFGESQFARSGTSFPSNASSFPVKPDNFPGANQFQNSQSFFVQKEVKEKSLDTLFNSTMYPDPFREEARNKGTFTLLFALVTIC